MTPQEELNRLKSSYAEKYGIVLSWAAELKADNARTSLVFTLNDTGKIDDLKAYWKERKKQQESNCQKQDRVSY